MTDQQSTNSIVEELREILYNGWHLDSVHFTKYTIENGERIKHTKEITYPPKEV